MALQTHSGYGTEDITQGTQAYDYAPVLLAALRMDEAVIAHIDVGAPVMDTAFYWEEGVLRPQTVTQSGTFATGATTLNVSSGHGKRVRIGTILQATTATSSASTQKDNGEQVQVTAVSTDALTVTRAYGLTADPGATYPASTIWKIVGQPLEENSDASTYPGAEKRKIVQNWTQIFERAIEVSRNQIKRSMRTVGDEFTYQLDQEAISIRQEMNNALIYSSQKPVFGGTFQVTPESEYRTFGGILWFLQKAGGAGAGKTFNDTAEALTPTVLNDLLYASFKLGGNPGTLFTGGKQARVIQSFDKDLVRIVPNERVRQAFTTLYRSDLGQVLSMVVDGNWSDGAEGTVALVDTSRVALRPFVDAEFFMLTAPTLKDGEKARLIAEWGLEFRNAFNTLDAHAIHTALTIP